MFHIVHLFDHEMTNIDFIFRLLLFVFRDFICDLISVGSLFIGFLLPVKNSKILSLNSLL